MKTILFTVRLITSEVSHYDWSEWWIKHGNKVMQEGHTNDVVSMCFVIRLFLLRFISAEEWHSHKLTDCVHTDRNLWGKNKDTCHVIN